MHRIAVCLTASTSPTQVSKWRALPGFILLTAEVSHQDSYGRCAVKKHRAPVHSDCWYPQELRTGQHAAGYLATVSHQQLAKCIGQLRPWKAPVHCKVERTQLCDSLLKCRWSCCSSAETRMQK